MATVTPTKLSGSGTVTVNILANTGTSAKTVTLTATEVNNEVTATHIITQAAAAKIQMLVKFILYNADTGASIGEYSMGNVGSILLPRTHNWQLVMIVQTNQTSNTFFAQNSPNTNVHVGADTYTTLAEASVFRNVQTGSLGNSASPHSHPITNSWVEQRAYYVSFRMQSKNGTYTSMPSSFPLNCCGTTFTIKTAAATISMKGENTVTAAGGDIRVTVTSNCDANFTA